MNRTLKRPMFKMGGAANGITSGLDRPGYAESDPKGVQKSTAQQLQEALGETPLTGRQELSRFLIPFGLNLATATPRGDGFSGLISSAAGAAKQPVEDLFARRDRENELQRKIRLEAAGIDIEAQKRAEAAAQKQQFDLDKLQLTQKFDLETITVEQANALERIGLKGAVDIDLLKERDRLEKENLELQGKIGSEQIILKNKEKMKAIEFEIQEKSKYPEIFGKSDSAFAVQTPEAVKGKYMDSFISQGGIFEDKSIELSNAYYNVLNNPAIDQATKNKFKDLTYSSKYDTRTKTTTFSPNIAGVAVGTIVYDATKGIYVERVQKSDDPRKDFIALDYATLKPMETGE
jgi:hypothetical protein